MRTVEEKLEFEQFKSDLLLRLLEAQLDSEAIERLKIMLELLDGPYGSEFIERVENNSNDKA